MKIADLASDPELVPSNLKGFDRSMRGGFITMRVRSMLDQDPTLRAPGNPADVADGKVSVVKGKLKGAQGELAAASARAAEIITLVTQDETADKLLSLDVSQDEADDSSDIDVLLVKEYLRPNPIGLKAANTAALKEKRKELVATIAWWAMAIHEQLQQPGKIDDLHLLVDRRLRVAERMLYYVATRSRARHFDINEIRNAPTGPWKDGTKRIFEYPNVKRSVFATVCNEDGNGNCQEPAMAGWFGEGITLTRGWKVSEAAKDNWTVRAPAFLGDYPTIVYKGGPASVPPVVAIGRIFTGSTDFKERNLLACDHVLHALHIEGLVAALVNRNQGAAFNTLVTSKPPGSDWLRIDSPWNSGAKGQTFGTFGAMPFVANPDEPAYFEHKRIRFGDLQVGDHLIVYNHPVFDRLVMDNTWRLENSLVVQVYPKLLLQGHGLLPDTPAGMRNTMLDEVAGALKEARALVEQKLATQPATGFPVIALTQTRRAVLVRRVPPASSQYIPQHQKADWWVCWIPGEEKGERPLATSTSSARRDVAWNEQKVEFVTPWDATATLSAVRTAVRTKLGITTLPETADPLAFFPLWQPAERQAGVKLTPQGKIDRITEVLIDDPMISVGGWYLPPAPEPRNEVNVIRPKA